MKFFTELFNMYAKVAGPATGLAVFSLASAHSLHNRPHQSSDQRMTTGFYNAYRATVCATLVDHVTKNASHRNPAAVTGLALLAAAEVSERVLISQMAEKDSNKVDVAKP